MLFVVNHSAIRRRLLRAMITYAMALVFMFSLLVPHPAPAVAGLDASVSGDDDLHRRRANPANPRNTMS